MTDDADIATTALLRRLRWKSGVAVVGVAAMIVVALVARDCRYMRDRLRNRDLPSEVAPLSELVVAIATETKRTHPLSNIEVARLVHAVWDSGSWRFGDDASEPRLIWVAGDVEAWKDPGADSSRVAAFAESSQDWRGKFVVITFSGAWEARDSRPSGEFIELSRE